MALELVTTSYPGDHVQTSLSISLLSEKTYVVWVKFPSVQNDGAYRGIFAEGDGGGYAGLCGIMLEGNKFSVYQAYDDVGNPGQALNFNTYDPTSVIADTWYHFAGVIDKANGLMKIYRNGALVRTYTNAAITSSTFFDSHGDARIGSLYGLYAAPETVDDVRFYNRVLSVNEVLTIYNCRGSDDIVDGLVSRWLMDEKHSGAAASGTGVVKDLVGNNNGTPSGSPVYRESILTTRRLIL